MDDRRSRIKLVPSFWTIWFPLFLGVGLVSALFALILFSSSTGNTQISMVSQIATILLALLIMSIGLFLLFLLIFGISGTQKVANRMPGWLARGRSFSSANLARVRRIFSIARDAVVYSELLTSKVKSAFKLLETKLFHK